MDSMAEEEKSSQIVANVKELHCSTQMGVTRTVRDVRPSHYMLQIDSYSFFDKERYESNVFEAGGFRWRLVLYPDGDTKRKGKGFVSLYLAIAGSDALPRGWEVNAIVKLFLLDQTRDKFLAVEGEGEVSRFYDAKPEYGFPQFISLDVFKNASNGYLVDDSCVLGAEVFVLKCSCKLEYLSFTALAKKPVIETFTWKITNFLALDKELYCSEAFVVRGVDWILEASLDRMGTTLSLFLRVRDIEKKQVVDAEFNLRMRDQVNGKHHEEMLSHSFTFYDDCDSCGLNQFITLRKLREPSMGFICKDTVIIDVEFTEINVKFNYGKNCYL